MVDSRKVCDILHPFPQAPGKKLLCIHTNGSTGNIPAVFQRKAARDSRDQIRPVVDGCRKNAGLHTETVHRTRKGDCSAAHGVIVPHVKDIFSGRMGDSQVAVLRLGELPPIVIIVKARGRERFDKTAHFLMIFGIVLYDHFCTVKVRPCYCAQAAPEIFEPVPGRDHD